MKTLKRIILAARVFKLWASLFFLRNNPYLHVRGVVFACTRVSVICVHVCLCACVHVCMCACVHVCMCACILCAFLYVCLYACVRMREQVSERVCVCVCVRVRARYTSEEE